MTMMYAADAAPKRFAMDVIGALELQDGTIVRRACDTVVESDYANSLEEAKNYAYCIADSYFQDLYANTGNPVVSIDYVSIDGCEIE